ncbi:LytR/AlgR family response regulator transcription factor [Leeuwenhoekiella aequorea]|uniref:LytTR family two component transcriptional regulator n=1 Tax=Leeuwenhoekiella aequorea TaxID=283736 RepID=A0A4Q0PAG3_9FLAO|nr:LytTR family DNA-binding domain-containing protein [Leeuwenhoekiella aequorea]RXG23754.1 LytTR family two component transcriptional regulator [Leeuwenhoekiella aequorea]
MNVLVIEDEKPAARRLTRMLEALDLNVLAQLNSVEEAITWFTNNSHPDLIFLDIQLSDGLSFEIFDAVTVTSAIIFTTAYDEYALQAFKLNSIDYLLKPIDDEELENAVLKFKKQNPVQADVKVNFDDIRKLLGINPVERDYKKRFTVKIGQHIKLINVEDIVCLYSENKGTYARTREQRDYLLDTTLELLEDELAPDQFFRVSRKYFVNIKAIEDIVSYTNSRLQVKLKSCSDQDIIVSRERVKDFKLWLS